MFSLIHFHLPQYNGPQRTKMRVWAPAGAIYYDIVKKLNLWHVIKSVASPLPGIQSSKARPLPSACRAVVRGLRWSQLES